MEINYSGKTALIVDSKLEDLGSLKNILGQLGVPQVQVASSVNMALSLMREIAFDLCFACYDMGGSEKNGLQLLQEAKAEGTFSTSGAFFLVVDPDSSELLFGSLENSPDTYISKPYDIGKVRFRLEKQLRIKETIQSVEVLLDQGKYQEVLKAVDVLISNYPGLNIFLQRIKGIALLRMGSYEQAKPLFMDLTKHRELPWAEVGKGIAYFNLGDYENSLECLNRVVDQQHVCAEAFTWLSRCYRAKGEIERAATLMRKAVMLQPTVPFLQAELANLTSQTGEWSIAKDAFQQAIKYARHSVFQVPENYFGLVKSLIESNENNLASVEPDIIRVLEDVVMDFSENQEVIFRAKLANTDLYRKENNQSKFDQMVLQTWRFFQRMDEDNQCKWLDLMLETAHETSIHSDVLSKRRELSKAIVEKDWGKANYSAMSCFKNGDMDKAFKLFKKANKLLPSHTGIGLNLIQTGIELIKRGDRGLKEYIQLQEVLAAINFGALPEKQQVRYLALSQRFSELRYVLRPVENTPEIDPFSQEL